MGIQSQSQRDAPAMLTAPKILTFSATKQMEYANQAVTSTKTAVTLSTVTAMMELLALVAVSAFVTLDVGTREAPVPWSKAVTELAKSTFAHPRAHQRLEKSQLSHVTALAVTETTREGLLKLRSPTRSESRGARPPSWTKREQPTMESEIQPPFLGTSLDQTQAAASCTKPLG